MGQEPELIKKYGENMNLRKRRVQAPPSASSCTADKSPQAGYFFIFRMLVPAISNKPPG
jgi:hypothetical protein